MAGTAVTAPVAPTSQLVAEPWSSFAGEPWSVAGRETAPGKIGFCQPWISEVHDPPRRSSAVMNCDGERKVML